MLTQRHRQIAAAGNLNRILDRRRQIGEKFEHLAR